MKKLILFFSLFALTCQAQISDELLQDTIDLWIVPNNAKSITAAKLNTILTHLNESKLNKDSNNWLRNSTNGYIYPAALTDNVGIGTNSPITSLDVRGGTYFESTGIAATAYEPNWFKSHLANITGNHYGLRTSLYMTNTNRLPYRVGAVVGEMYVDTTTEYIWNAVGVYGNVAHHGPDTVAEAAAFFGYTLNRGSGDITHAYGVKINAFENSGGGRILNGFGLYLASNAGVNITNKYGIYQVGRASNYFGGNLNLVTTTDTTGIIYKESDLYMHSFTGSGSNGQNEFIGRKTGNLTMAGAGALASYNTGVGYNVLDALTNGYSNTGVGWNVLGSVTTGLGNTAVGRGALDATTTTQNSTAVGNDALTNSDGSYNTGVGGEVMKTLSSGSYNTAVGHQALYTNSTGISNVAYGQGSGYSNTGNNNTFLGFRSGYLNTGNSNINIGYRAGYLETGSKKLYIANDSVQPSNAASIDGLLIYGDFDNNYINIFKRVSIGAYKNPNLALEVTGSALVSGYFKTGTGTIADNDATPDVSAYNTWIYGGTANSVTVTDLDNPVAGAYYTIIGNSDTYTVTLADSGNFKLTGSAVLGVDDSITLYCKADNYYVEISRANN